MYFLDLAPKNKRQQSGDIVIELQSLQMDQVGVDWQVDWLFFVSFFESRLFSFKAWPRSFPNLNRMFIIVTTMTKFPNLNQVVILTQTKMCFIP